VTSREHGETDRKGGETPATSEPPATRRPYVPPVLRRLGTVAELTAWPLDPYDYRRKPDG
jgi:hypothetical protein